MRVLVVGDSIADKYVYVEGVKLCQEGPVPVVRKLGSSIQAGGALNVFYNLKETGIDPYISTFVGDDPPGGMISQGLHQFQGLVEVSGLKTPLKIRYYEFNHLFLRVDDEDTPLKISESDRMEFLERLHHNLKFVDAVIISDYGKGTINTDTIMLIRNHEKDVFLDPFPGNHKIYRLLDHLRIKLITPNQKEFNQLRDLNSSLIKEEVPAIITRGANGSALLYFGGVRMERAITSFPVCVTGAGDVLLAYATAAILNGCNYNEALRIGNQAAGIAIQTRGNAICPFTKLGKNFRRKLPRGRSH